MKFRTQYDFHDDPTEVGTVNDEPTMTNQAEAKDTDINVIMRRYGATGQLPRVQSAQPQFGDFSNVGDYQEALESVIHAKEEFQKLPADIRKRFGNDPANLIQFVGDESNRTEAEKLGLLEPKTILTPSVDAEHIVSKLTEHFNGDTSTGTDDAAQRGKKQRARRTDE